MKIYRRLLPGLPGSRGLSDVDFLLRFQVLPPCALVALSRLMLLSRLLRSQQLPILALLHLARSRPKAWLNAIH
eukprot:6218395-Karenia_brevis.AAC.1